MKIIKTQSRLIRRLIVMLSILFGLSLSGISYLILDHKDCNQNSEIWMFIGGFISLSIITAFFLVYFLLKKQADILKQIRESELKFFTISKLNPTPTFITLASTGKFLFVNDAFARLFETTPEQLIGKTSAEIKMTTPEYRKEIIDSSIGGKVNNLEISITAKDRVFDILLSTEAMSLNDKDCFLGTMIDITEVKKTQKALENALTHEREMNAMKSNFVTIVSHEFRTPLAAILSSSDLVSKYTLTEQQPQRERHIARITSSVEILVSILEELLSIEKIETGSSKPSYTSFNLEKFTGDIIGDLKNGSQKATRIIYNHTGDGQIISDKAFIRHILTNLISNAIKYSPAESLVEVTSEKNDGKLSLKVKDSGIGIPAEDQDKIFTRFYRAKNAKDFAGTGLGLHIVKRYVDLLGGTIFFHSATGKGTEFVMTIPVSAQ